MIRDSRHIKAGRLGPVARVLICVAPCPAKKFSQAALAEEKDPDMCGIFGLVADNTSVTPDRKKLLQSAALLSHRGPDANSADTAPGVGMAHARLSLVDLDARSNQPFADPSGRYLMVFNGEVYNFRELRGELAAKGVAFHTTSDTEVVLQMLIHLPTAEALRRLSGMFAIAFYDRETRKLVLARDRFGMKPLYWTEGNCGATAALFFASEAKAFRPWLDLRPNQAAVFAYLMKFPGATQGNTMFDAIHSLPPGGMLELLPGKAPEISRFFTLPEFLDAGEYERLTAMSPTAIADEFEELMGRSIAAHRFADARVGAFCSGGVDSSLIVAMAARQTKDMALFHAEVKGSWSELKPAQALARHLGLELFHVEVEEQDFVDMIPRVMQHYEQPFSYHPNCPPLMMVAELGRQNGVKGLLSGEGSDELFLGYPWLGRKRLTDGYDRMIAGLRAAIRGIPGFGPILAPDRQANFAEVMSLMTGREDADDQDMIDAGLARLPQSLRDRTLGWTQDYLHHHLRTLLHRNDTMGMAASIEARFPFLDHDLARFGVNLPGRFKLRRSPLVWEKAHPFMRDKWVVRAVADRYLPADLSQRIKVGFWTTTFQRMEVDDRFFQGSPLGDLLGLSSGQLARTIETASQDLRLRFLHLDIWARTVVDNQSAEASVARLRDHVTIRPQGAPALQRAAQPGLRSAAAPF
ncbi:MAG: asparagine synthase (glutamine-hydrolyzing) [Albidovulum sp.]